MIAFSLINIYCCVFVQRFICCVNIYGILCNMFVKAQSENMIPSRLFQFSMPESTYFGEKAASDVKGQDSRQVVEEM